MKLEKFLKDRFGYTSFRPGQKEIIESVLNGSNTIAMLPTGTGKSLCYQLPGYLLNGQIIIISPLLSLMQDQADQLMVNGEKKVIAFNSFLTQEEKRLALKSLNHYKFIFISPEMLKSQAVIERLKQLEIALFVIDEAHCISQWGYDFRPDYLKLGEVREKLGNPLTLALTATATPEVKDDIIASLFIDTWNEFIFSVDRPNICLSIELLSGFQEKIERLVQLVNDVKGPGIIYFSSKKLAEQMVLTLKNRGIENVMAYHGGMEQESRILVQQQFINGQLDLICATSAFGMGINKDNIRFIIHFHMPLQLESYLQEIGRAGRGGERSIAVLLYAPGDEQLPLQLAESELPDETQVDWLMSWLEQNQQALGNIAEFENELRQLAGLTEIQWRMAEDFIRRKHDIHLNFNQSAAELKSFVQERLQVKRKKINAVYKWVHSADCRRENILKYFNEKKTDEIECCCDVCGIEMSVFKRESKTEEQNGLHFCWKDHLAQILISERNMI